MATPAEVEAAVHDVAQRLAELDPVLRRRYCGDRTVSCRISDLDVVWSGHLDDQGLSEVTDHDTTKAQVRLSVSSDDLLALTSGELALPAAWATGRLRVQASPLDLLRLRSLL